MSNISRELFYLTKKGILSANIENHDNIQITLKMYDYLELTNKDIKKYRKYWIKKGWEFLCVGGEMNDNYVHIRLRKVEDDIIYGFRISDYNICKH